MPSKKYNNRFNNIWIVTREYSNLAGAGGVKDMAKQLAEALANSDRKVNVVLPCYGFINPKEHGFARLEQHFDVDMNYAQEDRRELVEIWKSSDNPTIYLISSPRFTDKLGVYTYTTEEEEKNPDQVYGTGHYDYFAMNVLLQKSALNLIIRLGEKPDIIHCHDGHTALIPAMIKESEGFRHYFHQTGCVLTIHNAGRGYHQEVADLPFAQAITCLPNRVILDNQLDGAFDPLLAASAYGTLNTVSENYARELRETYDDDFTGWLGHRLMARGVELAGITNGIDPLDFDLANPKKLGIPAGFNPAAPKSSGLPGKKRCKKELLAAIKNNIIDGIEPDGTIRCTANQPLFTFIGRLTAQKGVDKLIDAVKKILPINKDFRILILGTGDKNLEKKLIRLATDEEYFGRVCVIRAYDPSLANRIYAAGDFFLVPSRYEPCGLTDFIAQLFGNIPIVHHIGGLVKVVDGKTGFAYQEHSASALCVAMMRAINMYENSPQKIIKIQKAAIDLINKKYTWQKVMLKYLELYHESATLVASQKI